MLIFCLVERTKVALVLLCCVRLSSVCLSVSFFPVSVSVSLSLSVCIDSIVAKRCVLEHCKSY